MTLAHPHSLIHTAQGTFFFLSTPHFTCSKAEQPHKWLIGVFIMCKWVVIINAACAYALWCRAHTSSTYSLGIYLGMGRLMTDTLHETL